jgi:glycerophosphoryl diester phosphodiesterase
MLLDELLDSAPSDLVIQVEVKAYGDPALTRATAAAVARLVDRPADRDRVEVISFHVAACEEAARLGLRARLVTWSDYAPDALARWARRSGVAGVCVEHFLLHPELVHRLRTRGLSVTTGTINDAALAARAAGLGVDAITSDRPAGLRAELLAALRRAA